MKYQVDEETAVAEFERFVDANDIDLGAEDISAQDKADTEQMKRAVIRYIRTGLVSIGDSGLPTVHASKNDLVFREPTGQIYTAMDTRKKDHEMAKIFASIAVLTGTSIATINSLSNREVRAAMTIWSLFLAQ